MREVGSDGRARGMQRVTARMYAMAGIGVLVLGLVIAGLFWVLSRQPGAGESILPDLTSNASKVAETTILTCEEMKDGSGWVSAGTVHNSTGSARTYLVSVAFSGPDGPVGYGQAQLTVAAGQSAPWAAAKKFDIGDGGLTCGILAVS